MKRFKFFAIALPVMTAATMLIYSCSKKEGSDSVSPQATSLNTGTDILKSDSGTDKRQGMWQLDKAHCNVMWETKFYGDNAILTGRFNNFMFKMNFDQAHLDQSWMKGWVQLSTFNTGESGRDAWGSRDPKTHGFKNGCGPNYMGIVWDSMLKSGVYVEIPNPNTDTAWFKSTSIVKYGTGYLCHGTITFLRENPNKVSPVPATNTKITKPVDFYFTYTGITDYRQVSGDPKDSRGVRCGMIGSFDMKAISDFGCTSTSISDVVTVRVDANWKKNL